MIQATSSLWLISNVCVTRGKIAIVPEDVFEREGYLGESRENFLKTVIWNRRTRNSFLIKILVVLSF
jgi:hypothetical protein